MCQILGTGKTALAVHWAHAASDRFPDGQLYVPLHGSSPAGPSQAEAGEPGTQAGPAQDVLPGLLGALGLPPDLVPGGADAQAALFRSLLAGKRMLLVLDDAAGSEQAAPLLPGCAGCLVLVTSRAPLTGLVAARSARVLTLTALDPAAAWQMLAGRLGPERLAAEAGAVAELADVCARLPATLAAVAAHAAAHPGLPLAALAAELRAAAPQLKRLRPPPTPGGLAGPARARARTRAALGDRP